MMYHDNDQLPEESQTPDLITDLQDLYTFNAADAQSLKRIRMRLHDQEMTPQATQHTPLQPLIPLPTATALGKGIPMHQHFIAEQKTQEQKAIPWHQRVNRFAAVLVTIVVVGALIATFTLVHRSSTSSQPETNGSAWMAEPSPFGAQIQVINNTTAWIATTVPALGGTSIPPDPLGPLLRSTDGEKTWQDVTPPELSFSISPYMLRTLKDGVTAWIFQYPYPSIPASEHTGTVSEAHLLRTIDGGKSWQKLAVPQVTTIWNIEFVDQEHGWLEATSDTGTQQKILFSTADGGETWQQIPQTPLSITPTNEFSPMQFVDPQTGWLASTPSQREPQKLYVTHDGGTSWSPLAVPAGIDTSITTKFFQFMDAQHGFVFHYPSFPKWLVTFYTTKDGGQTWQGPFSIQTALQDNYYFLNDHQIIVVDKKQIIVYTLNKGQWVKSSQHAGAPINLSSPLSGSTFISDTVGMAVINYTHPDTFPVSNTDHFGLLKTTNGGASWSQIQLTVPTKKVTPYTMAYLTNPGWTYYTALQNFGSTTLTEQDLLRLNKADTPHLPNLQAKKWLVRFMCSTSASSANLSFNGQQFSTPNCDQRPVSKVVTFDSPQSFQTLKVTIQGHNSWLATIEACTNEEVCQADGN